MTNPPRVAAIALVLVGTVCDNRGRPADDWTEAEKYQAESERYREEHFDVGFARFRQVDLQAGDADNAVEGSERLISMWFDGECQRTDVESIPRSTHFRGSTCGETYIRILDDQTPVTIAPLDEHGGRDETIRQLGLMHPRWLGMGSNPLGSLAEGRRYRSLYFPDRDQADAASLTTRTDEIEGVRATCFEFRSRGTVFGKVTPESEEAEYEYETRRAIWVAPDRGYALLRSEVETTYPGVGVSTLSLVASSYAKIGDQGIWYPRQSVRSLSSDSALVSGVRTTVVDISLDPPDPAVFTLAGMDVKEGRKIVDRSEGPRELEFLWDGNQAVPIEATTEIADAIVPNKAENRTWLLVVNAAALTGIGIYLLLVRHRKRSDS